KLRAGGILQGKVVDASGDSLRAEIRYQKNETSDAGPTMTETSPDGTFELQGLEPGAYELMARAHDGRIARSHGVVVGAGVRVNGLVLTCEEGAKLKIRYEGKDEQVWFQVRSDGLVVANDSATNKGPASEQAVPSGHLTIELHSFEAKSKGSVRS